MQSRVCNIGLTAILAVLVNGSPALAGDSLTNWTGWHLGVEIGSSPVTSSLKMTPGGAPQQSTTVGTVSYIPAMGIFAGYDYQFAPRYVLGGELEVQRFEKTNYALLGASTVDFLETSNWSGNLSARLGYLAAPNTLIYGRLGVGLLDVSGFEGFGEKFSRTLVEFHGGLGVEARFAQNFAIRYEGTYTGGQSFSLNSDTYRYSPAMIQSKIGLVWTPWAPEPTAPAPAPTFAPNWTGLELGGLLTLSNHYMKVTDSTPGAALFGDMPFATTAVGGTLLAGLNWQFHPKFVVGLEGSAQLTTSNIVSPFGSGGIIGTYYRFAQPKDITSVGLKFGWLATPEALFFVKGGPAWMHVGLSSDFWNDVAPNDIKDHLLRAWQVGGGVEAFVSQNVSVRLEGAFTQAVQTIKLNGTNGPNEFALKPYSYALSSGIAYHF